MRTNPIVPFDKIKFYQRSFLSPPLTLHAIIKHKGPIKPEMGPRIYDTFYYTVPVRQAHAKTYQNMIVAFTCPHVAKAYVTSLNASADTRYRNMEEPARSAFVESFRTEELAHNALMVSLPIVVVKNSYCASQQEPYHEVIIVLPSAMPG